MIISIFDTQGLTTSFQYRMNPCELPRQPPQEHLAVRHSGANLPKMHAEEPHTVCQGLRDPSFRLVYTSMRRQPRSEFRFSREETTSDISPVSLMLGKHQLRGSSTLPSPSSCRCAQRENLVKDPWTSASTALDETPGDVTQIPSVSCGSLKASRAYLGVLYSLSDPRDLQCNTLQRQDTRAALRHRRLSVATAN